MKFDCNKRIRLREPDYKHSTGLKRQVSDSDYRGMDLNLQSHLGRTLRRVYEPDVESDLPPDLMNLLKQLDTVSSGSSKSS